MKNVQNISLFFASKHSSILCALENDSCSQLCT